MAANLRGLIIAFLVDGISIRMDRRRSFELRRFLLP